MNIDHPLNNRFNKLGKAIKLFLIVFGILSIGTGVGIILLYSLSIDSGFWPIALILSTIINIFLAMMYALISSAFGIARISYRYTIAYTSVFSIINITLDILYYNDTYTTSYELGYSILGIFLVLHLLICWIKKYL